MPTSTDAEAPRGNVDYRKGAIAVAAALTAIGLSYYFGYRYFGREAVGDAGRTNTALLFIKPHAQTQQVQDFLQKELRSKGLRIIRQGQIRGDSISEKGTIDSHYAAIGLYAMKFPPKDLAGLLTAERAKEFAAKYGITFEEAVEKGRIVNAAECMKRFGWDAKRVADSFERAKEATMFKIAPGCYSVMLDNGTLLINGFYLRMRAEYVDRNAVVTWVVVEWNESALSWANFRNNVLGATDPAKASPSSLRYRIMKNASELGLNFTPNMGMNCIHGSASPLEALNERLVWTGIGKIDKDAYGRYLISRGLSIDTITKMLGNQKVDGIPIFDTVEDMNSSECAAKLLELASKL